MSQLSKVSHVKAIWGPVTRGALFCRHIEGSPTLLATPRGAPRGQSLLRALRSDAKPGEQLTRPHTGKLLYRPSLEATCGEEEVDVSQGHFRGDTGFVQSPRAGKVLKHPPSSF